MKKELREIAKALNAQGFEVRVTKKQNLEVRKDGRKVATFSGNASDWRSMTNSLADARRAGFLWKR